MLFTATPSAASAFPEDVYTRLTQFASKHIVAVSIVLGSRGSPYVEGEGGGELYSYQFGWPVAVLFSRPFFSSVAMRLGPVLAGPVYSCVGAAGCFGTVCCVRGGGGGQGKKPLFRGGKGGGGGRGYPTLGGV